jgi:hypothetical protein
MVRTLLLVNNGVIFKYDRVEVQFSVSVWRAVYDMWLETGEETEVFCLATLSVGGFVQRWW